MEEEIDRGDFDEFRRLSGVQPEGCRRHCGCIDEKPSRCLYLLPKAVGRYRTDARFLEYMLENGFPTGKTSLLEAAEHDDVGLLRRLYGAGCRFRSYDDIFRCRVSPAFVHAAVEECELPLVGNFAFVVQYADADVLEYAYKHLQELRDADFVKEEKIDVVGPLGFRVAALTSKSPNAAEPGQPHDTRYGFNCYHAAIYHGTLERFEFVASRRIPMYSIDADFWRELLSQDASACSHVPTTYDGAQWRAGASERRNIKEWCLEHGFSVSSEALAAAFLYGDDALVSALLSPERAPAVVVDARALAAALLSRPLETAKQICAATALSPSVWTSVAGHLTDAQGAASDKLEWLMQVNCPRPADLIARIIAHAPKDRLDWLVRHAGVAPTSACWAALSNRYRMNDTTAMLKWLSDQGCPPDPLVAEHLDINRPHAIQIIEHVTRRMRDHMVSSSDDDSDLT